MRHSSIEPLEARIAPATVSIASTMIVNEGDGTTPDNIAHIKVTLDTAADADTVVAYRIDNDTAMAGSQFNYPTGAADGSVTIPMGTTSATIDIPLIGNTAINSDTAFKVMLVGATGADLSSTDTQSTVTIWDDDVTVNFTAGSLNQSIAEGNSGTSDLTFTVSLSGHADHPITVNFATADGTAVSSGDAADFIAKTGTLTFAPAAAGVTPDPQTFTVSVKGDTLPGPDESFNVQLAKGSADTAFGAKLGPNAQTSAKITNDEATTVDDTLTVMLTSDPSASEGGTASFGITLNHPSESPVIVKYHTADGTAKAGADQDFVDQGAGTITLSSAQPASISVKINSDTMIEPVENFTLMLDSATASGAPVALGTKTSATATIAADPLPKLIISDASVLENATGAEAVFHVTLLSDIGSVFTTTQAITVHYATMDGTATGGADASTGDYVIKSSDLTIPAGTTQAGSFDIHIPINKDTVAESNETFTVKLSAPTNATLADDTGVGTIIDGSVGLKIGALSVNEGNEGTNTGIFALQLTKPVPTGFTLRVDYATVDGTALAGSDYTAASGSLDFAAGTSVQTVPVTIFGDHVLEGNETFNLKVTNARLVPTSGDVVPIDFAGDSPSQVLGTGTIVNDESTTLTASVTAAAATVPEGPSTGTPTAGFTLHLSEAYTSDVTVGYTVVKTNADGTKTTTMGTKVIPALATTAALDPIAYEHADTVGHDQVISVTLNSVTPATPLAGGVFRPLETAKTATTTVLEDDVYVRVEAVNAGGQNEGDSGTSAMPFKVSLVDLSGNLVTVDHAVTVPFHTVDGTGVNGASSVGSQADFVAKTGTFTIPAGQKTSTVNVTINGDTLAGNDENFTVQLGTPTGALLDITKDSAGTVTADHSVATGTIKNDDGAPTTPVLTLTAGPAAAEGGAVTFTAHLSQASDSTVAFDYATAVLDPATGGPDRASAGDFAAISSAHFVLANGQTSGTLTVNTVQDTENENAETFGLTLSNIQGATIASGTTLSAVGTILASDQPTLSVANVSVAEGNSGTKTLTFTYKLVDATGATVNATKDVTFNVHTVGITATGGDDYVELPSTPLTIAAGTSQITQDVTIKGDTTDGEGDETFRLQATDVKFATAPAADAIGTIQNDEGVFTVTGPAAPVSESAGFANFTITRSGDLTKSASVVYKTNPGTALSSGAQPDFQALTGAVSFPAGVSSKTLQVPIFNDNHYESAETFTVSLSSPVNGVVATTTDPGASASATIANDDAIPTVKLSGPVTVKEGDSGTTDATFTVTLDRVNEAADVHLKLSTVPGTALADQDFTAVANQTVTIPKGQLSATFKVQVKNDLTYDSLATETFGVSLVLDPADAAAPQAKFATGVSSLTSTVKIVDNELAPQVSVAAASIDEGSGSVFAVTLNHPSDRPVTVQYYTVDGSAVSTGAAKDFNGKLASAPGTITFAAGVTTASVTGVTTIDDGTVEGNETFKLQLVKPVGATLNQAHGSAIGTIVDNDLASLTINDVSISEGNDGTKDAVFTVTLVGDTVAPVTVNYATAMAAAMAGSGVATSGSDFLPTAGTLTLGGAHGAHTAQIAVKVVGDLGKENSDASLLNERFNVVLSNATVATIAKGTGVGTILDDGDTLPTLSVANVTAIEGNSSTGDTQMTFIAKLSAAPAGPVTFTVHTSEIASAMNAARLGTDFVQPKSSTDPNQDLQVTIPADDADLSVTFNVTIKADDAFEPTEFFNVTLANITGAAPGNVMAKGTILDSDISLVKPNVAKWTDVDGDLVTLTASKGSLAGRAVFTDPNTTTGGHLLQLLDLATNAGRTFSHANISIVATQQPDATGVLTGNGRSDVGYIRANNADSASSALEITGVDLGTVKIDGDLSRISVGDLFSDTGLGTLDVYSLGVNSAASEQTHTDPTTQQPVAFAGPAQSTILAGVSNFKVATDVAGFVAVEGGTTGKIGNLQIGGALTGATYATSDSAGHISLTGHLGKASIHDIIGGGGGSSGLLSLLEGTASAGAITVIGNVTGGTGNFSGGIIIPKIASIHIEGSLHGTTNGGIIAADNSLGSVTIDGNLDSGAKIYGGGLLNNHAIKSVIVHGNVSDAKIYGGYGQSGNKGNADAQIDYVQVDGSVAKLDLLAGVAPVAGSSGTVSSLSSSGFSRDDASLFSRIARVVFNGSIVANSEEHDISAQSIGLVTVGGVPVTPTLAGTELVAGTNFKLRFGT